MNKKHLLIGTTAINRPILHSDIIKEWGDWVRKLDNSWSLAWFINVDYIESLGASYDETKENLLKEIDNWDNRFDIKFLPKKKAHFLNACKKISQNMVDYVNDNNINENNVVIFWLEDDWKLNVQYPHINIKHIVDDYLNGYHYFNLTFIRNNYIWALAPSLSNYKLWKQLFYEGWKNETRDIDPEHSIGLYYRKRYGHPDNIINITLINKKIKEHYFSQKFLSAVNSYYSYVNPKYKLLPHKENYIATDKFTQPIFGDNMVMIRMSPNMSIDGCQYARKFMDKHAQLVKTKKGLTFIYKKQDGKERELNTKKIKLTILYLINKKTLINKMSRVRFHGMNKLCELVDVIYSGIGWEGYDNNKTVTENIKMMDRHIDYIIAYKPSELKGFNKVKIPKCLRYNEMWDETETLYEINSMEPDLIVCHHKNDMIRYMSLRKNISYYTELVHNPHCAEKSIFYDKNYTKDIDILLCGTIGRHYPFRQRMLKLLNKFPKKYNVKKHEHPGYLSSQAHTDIFLKDFSEYINRAKICITCTSKYFYRLGKMVEIPMCGSVLACDMPKQDELKFRSFMIVLNKRDTDGEIIKKLTHYLDNPHKLETLRQRGLTWSKQYTQEHYASRLVDQILDNIKHKKSLKLFIQAEDLTLIKEKWICDILRDELSEYSTGLTIVKNVNDSDIIWLLAPWCKRKLNQMVLNSKFVITTIHHIDWDKYDAYKDYYKQLDAVTNRYHVICKKTYDSLRKITNKKIVTKNFWINNNNFYLIENKRILKNIYKIPSDHYIIGSFQKDTEGSDNTKPKLSKGPDIFIKIVEDMKNMGKKPFIILTGWRRTYIIMNLKRLKIPYCYHETIDKITLNELYNCLDLYVVSSRVEGGPRSILECGLAKVPIISTDVGMSNEILHPDSIYDVNIWETYREAIPNTEYAYKKSYEYKIENYMDTFIKNVFYELK
jgi:hypothetical protein